MIDQYKIYTFNFRHDVTEDQQLKCLMEEVGELAEAYNRAASDEEVAEELADVLFVARSLAELRDINITGELNEVIEENLEKSESTDGEKVTKDGADVPLITDNVELNRRDEQNCHGVGDEITTVSDSDGKVGLDHAVSAVQDIEFTFTINTNEHPWEDDPRYGSDSDD